MALVNTDSLGMFKSLQYFRYRDVAMRVMASYMQRPYKFSFHYNVSDSPAIHETVLYRSLRHVLWCDLAHLVLVSRLGQTNIHLGISLGLECSDSCFEHGRQHSVEWDQENSKVYLFVHIHSGVRG